MRRLGEGKDGYYYVVRVINIYIYMHSLVNEMNESKLLTEVKIR